MATIWRDGREWLDSLFLPIADVESALIAALAARERERIQRRRFLEITELVHAAVAPPADEVESHPST